MLRLSLLLCALCASTAAAQNLPLACEGSGPNWRLDLLGPVARFHFPALTEMEIPLRTRAEGRDWPRALTLIGERDTAIVVLHERACSTAFGQYAIEAQVLTQRGQTPILLTGCCAVAQ